MPTPSSHATPPARMWIAYAALALAVLALYARVLWFPFLAFDDAEFIVRNPEVVQPWAAPLDLFMTPRVGYIVPVTVAFEALLHALSRGEAWSFHLAGLALHGLCVVQVCAWARQLGCRPAAAFAAALLFAVHPLVVQPVAWAICIKDLLMANLALAATRAFVAGRQTESPRMASAVTLAVLAMLAKPSAVLLGAAWLVYALAQPEPPLQPALRRGALAVTGIGVLLGLASRTAHDAFLGAEPATDWTPLAPLAVLGRQCLHTLWPANLLIAYPPPEADPARGSCALLGAAIVACLAWLCVRSRRSPESLLLVGVGVALYLPTSGIIPFARVMSDSYLYVPLACACTLAARALDGRLQLRPQLGRAAFAAGLALAAALATSAALQLPRWRGGTALWQPVVHAHPRLALAHRLMGDELVFRGEPAHAVAAYQRAFALEYDPRFLLEFGTTLSMAGRVADAECVLIEAMAYGSDRGYALYNFATLLAFHPEYAPEHAAVAKRLLRDFERMRRTQQLSFPPALEPGLARQIARLDPTAPEDARWPQRNCAVLARAVDI